MSKNFKYIITAFLVFSFIACVVFAICFKSADIKAVYTRNNLDWTNAEVFEDGSVKLDLKKGKTTISLKNDVKGNVGYNIFLYAEKGASGEVLLTSKDMTEISKNEYPEALKNYDVKCAYRGYLEGKDKRNFVVESYADADMRLLMVMEDNNSYPKDEKNLPTLANVKFSAEVLLDGQYPRGKKFSFSLKNDRDEVIETVHNDDGYISFSNIALKEKGTYIYYLTQNEGKDKKTSYDKSIYKIKVAVEDKNAVTVSYEKDGTPKHTLPRFSNYKEIKNNINPGDVVEYPTNAKRAEKAPNYLLISALAVAFLLVLFYMLMGRKRG